MLQGFILTLTGPGVWLIMAGFSEAALQAAGTAGFGSSLQDGPKSALHVFILGSRLCRH